MKKKTKYKLERIVSSTMMLLLSTIVVIPILIMVLGSFKTPAEAQLFNIALPTEWRFDNYIYVVKVGGIGRALINSFVVTTFSVLICVLSSAFASFIIARKGTKFSSALYNVFLLGMVAPMQVITTFGLLKVLNIMGTYFSVILLIAAVQIPWSIFIFTGFIKGIPREMDEAAFIDGAGPVRMFLVVILPLLKPVLVTNIVAITMSAWNEFMIPLYFFNTTSKWTLPLTVYNFFGQYFNDWNYVFANLVITALPITILYLYCQKYIVAGMTAGAVKG